MKFGSLDMTWLMSRSSAPSSSGCLHAACDLHVAAWMSPTHSEGATGSWQLMEAVSLSLRNVGRLFPFPSRMEPYLLVYGQC